MSKVKLSFNDQDMFREAGNLFEGFNRVIAMIKDTKEKHDIELADRFWRELRHIDFACIHLYAKCRACKIERFAAAKMRMGPAV